jgi:Ca2+-binding RTX toxin-like protein
MGIPNGTEGFRIDNSEGTVTALFNDSAPVIAISGIENFGGSNLDDRFIGSGIGELVSGGGGDDILSAGGGADTLLGGSGDDTLIGGQGADTIFGGAGNDLLTGGTETDTFVIQHVRAGATITSFGSDMIVDFDARSPGSGGDILHFGLNGNGTEMRRLDGRVIDEFGDLDTNGDGLVALGDMGVTAHQGGITLGFDSGFLSLDGVDQLFAGSFDFGTFDLYA